MKKVFIALMLLGGLMCSCSNSIDNEDNDTPEVATEQGNTVFKFSSSDISVFSTRSVEDSYISEQGTENEWTVNNVRIYLFDNVTKQFAKTCLLKNLTRTNDGQPGYITYTSERVNVASGVYDIFAVANTNNIINASTESEFINNIDTETYRVGQIQDTSNGIMMTNRASANLKTCISGSVSVDDENVVDIMLERVVARIDVARSSDSYQMRDANDKVYASISLTDFHYVNLPNRFYTFRHNAILTSMTEPEWDIQSHFGEVADVNGYVIDPYFFEKRIDASSFANADGYYVNYFRNYYIGDNVKWIQFKKASSTSPQYNTCYSLENCTMQAAQKNGYSTGVVFRGELTPNDNVYGVNDAGEFIKLSEENYPQTLYYFNYKFYNSITALSKAGVDITEKMTDEELSFSDVKRFVKEDGKYYSYYSYWVRHMDNNDPLMMGVMEFGIVRNNLYRLLVTKITDLGPGNPKLDPDTPDEGEAYLKVEINVKPWIVRKQENIVL